MEMNQSVWFGHIWNRIPWNQMLTEYSNCPEKYNYQNSTAGSNGRIFNLHAIEIYLGKD